MDAMDLYLTRLVTLKVENDHLKELVQSLETENALQRARIELLERMAGCGKTECGPY